MKLFLRDQMPLIVVNFFQIVLSSLIYHFDQSGKLETEIYVVILNIFLLLVYLGFRYFSLSSFFERLSEPAREDQLDESFSLDSKTSLGKALQERLYGQYTLYQQDILQYKQKLDRHTVFINQWIHQMKTPLSVIDLTIQAEDEPIFDSIRDEVDRLKRGLETVLYTSRLELFERDFHAEPVGLHQVVKQVVTDYRRFFIRNRVYPEIQIDESIFIQSDHKWLCFVLGQLITNSVRYSAGVSDKVIFSSFQRGKKVGLEIIDFGVGIPKQDKKKVFQPYFTGENGRLYSESTGMGLYLLDEVCKFLDHEVELESEQGKGTTIRLLFRENIHSTYL
ncbi:sensor histidine kinase [Shimazuella kribbensis]|uniref:sensor histidine kinase n=1 Tax=Shimazuella kribbensis TaxID=139808 RepID=UPI00048CB54F|nr:sensor histidine kinase [Shimazuella kribbensis]